MVKKDAAGIVQRGSPSLLDEKEKGEIPSTGKEGGTLSRPQIVKVRVT